MTAPQLTVRRFSATARDPALDRARLDRMLRQVAARRLGSAIDRLAFPPGEWCIRRLDVPVRLDLAGPDPSCEQQWALALADALQRALTEPSAGVVHYRHRLAALADLVGAVACGQVERAWAWRRLGLLGPEDPAVAPGAVLLAALRRRPEHATAALVAAAGAVGIAALDRALGAAGWVAVAEVGAAAAGAARRIVTRPAGECAVSPGAVPSARDGVRRETGSTRRAPDQMIAAALLGTSRLAELMLRSRLRPGARTALAWAVLVAAEADPAALRGSGADGVVDALAAKLAPAAAAGRSGGPPGRAGDGPPEPGSNPGPQDPPRVLRPVASHRLDAQPGHVELGSPEPQPRPELRVGPPAPPPRPAAAFHPDRPPPAARTRADARVPEVNVPPPFRSPKAPQPTVAVPAPVDPTGRPTQWGGLAFLLATAADAGLPDAVVDDQVLGARPLRWVLRTVGRTLVPLPANDPALLALAGPTPDPQGDPAPDDAERIRLDALTASWAEATAARLDGDEDARAVVRRLARRRAEVFAEPGWVDVHLRLDEVDVRVRRAGLDLDPGWVPWLGMVVRFRYAS